MQKMPSCTFPKLIVLLILGALFILMMELRFEHMDELGDHWQAWIPIFYSGIMVVIGIAGLWLWEKGGRKVLLWTFSLSIIIGLLGVWFHEKGKPWNSITTVATAWQAPIIKKHKPPTQEPAAKNVALTSPAKKKKKPKPPLAPLAFAGIGLLGMLACSQKIADG